jgi:hypothetical protein
MIKFKVYEKNTHKFMQYYVYDDIHSEYYMKMFTGLLDSTGEEIYDGDSIEVGFETGRIKVGVVEWSEEGACYILRFSDEDWIELSIVNDVDAYILPNQDYN